MGQTKSSCQSFGHQVKNSTQRYGRWTTKKWKELRYGKADTIAYRHEDTYDPFEFMATTSRLFASIFVGSLIAIMTVPRYFFANNTPSLKQQGECSKK